MEEYKKILISLFFNLKQSLRFFNVKFVVMKEIVGRFVERSLENNYIMLASFNLNQ